jgi:uncharacterized protein (DUF1778 family)
MTRTHTIVIRVDDDEKARIERAANLARMSVSDYLRRCADVDLFKGLAPEAVEAISRGMMMLQAHVAGRLATKRMAEQRAVVKRAEELAVGRLRRGTGRKR